MLSSSIGKIWLQKFPDIKNTAGIPSYMTIHPLQHVIITDEKAYY
jgi:hypothetical protein